MTEYQTHQKFAKNVIDFCEKKLLSYSKMHSKLDDVESGRALTLHQQYLNNQIAIKWQDGKPVSLLLTADEISYSSCDDETYTYF